MKKSIFLSHLQDASREENISFEKALEYARSLGYQGADIDWADLCKKPVELTEKLRSADIQIASVYKFCDFASSFSELEMQRFLECVAKCDCEKVMIIPGFFKDNSDIESETAAMIEALAKTCGIAKEYNVTVTVENFDDRHSPCGNISSLKYLLESVSELRYTLDTGNYAYFDENVLTALSLFSEKIVHVHLKDRYSVPFTEGETATKSIFGKPLFPAPAGCGIIPIKECIKELKRLKYNGYLSVEHFNAKSQLKYMTDSAERLDRLLLELQ